jgi:hypothetical protein
LQVVNAPGNRLCEEVPVSGRVSRLGRQVASFAFLTLGSCVSGTDPTDDSAGDPDTDADTDSDTDSDSDTDTNTDTDSDPSCNYMLLDQYVVDCGGTWASVVVFQDLGGDPDCPPYYQLDGTDYPTMSAALSAKGCDDSCVYSPFTSVMFLHCDLRAEFFEFRDGGPDQSTPPGTCDPLLYFWSAYGSGWYPSLAVFQEENPCPET